MIRQFVSSILIALFLYSPAVAGSIPRTGPIELPRATVGGYKVAQAIPFPGPGSRDRNIKVTGIGSSGTAGPGVSSLTMTTTAAIPLGATVVIAISYSRSSTISVTSVSDGTNNYALAAASGWSSGTFVALDFWYKVNANAVSSGATITATLSTSTSNDPGGYMAAALVLNLSSAPFDKSNFTQYGGPTTAPSSGATATLAQANEVCFGAATGYTSPPTSTTRTESSGWTNLVSINNGGSTRDWIIFGYKIVSATTAQNYQPTTGSPAVAVSGIVTLKGL